MRSLNPILMSLKFSSAFSGFSLVMLAGFAAQAIPSPLQVKPGSAMELTQNGVITGGQSEVAFSLLHAEMRSISGGGDRMTLVYGDRVGKPKQGVPGFYQISLDRDGRRITIDLAQVDRTGVDPAVLRKKLQASRLVSSVDMTMDPHDQSTNITLVLREPVRLSVQSAKSGQPSTIEIAMRPSNGQVDGQAKAAK